MEQGITPSFNDAKEQKKLPLSWSQQGFLFGIPVIPAL